MAQEYELNLRDYLRIIRKRYKVIIALGALVGLSTFLFTPREDPAYVADALIKVTHQSTVASLFVSAVTWSYGDDLSTQSKVINSHPLALEVGKRLGMFEPDRTVEDLVDDENLSRQVGALQAKYSAKPMTGTSIIAVSAKSESPDFSVRLVNTVVDTFIEQHTYRRNKQVIEARKFIAEQLEKYEIRLKEAENRYTQFKKDHLTSLSLSENEMSALKADLENYNRRIRSLSTLVANLESRLESPASTYIDLISGGFEDPAVEELNDELVRLQVEREDLLVEQMPDSPKVRAIENKILGLASRLLEEYKETLHFLVTTRDRLQARFMELPENDAYAVRLAREVKINEDTYTLLKQRYQEALIKEAEKIEELNVVEYAANARIDAPPGRTVRSLVGALVGLLLGMVLAFVLETLDTSIDTIEDVETYLEVPVCGIIPHFDIAQAEEELVRKRPQLAGDPCLRHYAAVFARSHKTSPVAEAYRTLRTNLQFAELRHGYQSSEARRGKTFLVTSSSPGEGKSTTIVNLAVVLAQMGKKVLLFDCDLRSPKVNKHFGVSRSPGFTDAVLGSTSLMNAVRSSTTLSSDGRTQLGSLAAEGLDSLHILTSGTIPPHPADVLVSHRFDEALKELQRNFDMILIDAPPILPVTDAAIIGSKIDGVLLVHTLGRVSRTALRRSKTLLENVKADIWGIVLNNIRANVTGYSMSSYYGEKAAQPASPIRAPLVLNTAARQTLEWLRSTHLPFGFLRRGGNGNGKRTDTDQTDLPEA